MSEHSVSRFDCAAQYQSIEAGDQLVRASVSFPRKIIAETTACFGYSRNVFSMCEFVNSLVECTAEATAVYLSKTRPLWVARQTLLI
jgi:hypothetical protein